MTDSKDGGKGRLWGLYSPEPQSGKSTIAERMVKKGVIRGSFAGALKGMLNPLLSWLGYGMKELSAMLDGDRKGEVIPVLGKTPRELMQTLGTEWGRQMVHLDIWVAAVRKLVVDAAAAGQSVVIDDMRFPNEFEMVKGLGGTTVKVLRPGRPAPETSGIPGHASEGGLEDQEFDIVLEVPEGIEALHAAADRLMAPAIISQKPAAPIVYIAGRYRHYAPSGGFNRDAMEQEVADEADWMRIAALAGLMWIAPLHNSIPLETAGAHGESVIPGDEYVVRDCWLLEQLRPVMLMRSGWRAHHELPHSVGAAAEYSKARELGLDIIDADHIGDMAAADELRALARE